MAVEAKGFEAVTIQSVVRKTVLCSQHLVIFDFDLRFLIGGVRQSKIGNQKSKMSDCRREEMSEKQPGRYLES